MRHVFWRRISASLALAGNDPKGIVLDYGCGAGACLPALSRSFGRVYGWDLDVHSRQAAQQLSDEFKLQNVEILEQMVLADSSVDVIIALDVLEHVDGLPDVLNNFKRILKPNGKIIVCSPTENFIYRSARLFAPKGYKGEFHKRAAREVEQDLGNVFKVRLAHRLYPIATFFRIVIAYKN